jgi:MFS family permease
LLGGDQQSTDRRTAHRTSAAKLPKVFNTPVRLLRERDLRLILAGYALSALGDYLALLALTLRVHDQTGSGFAVAALLLTGTLPILLLAPLAGWVVDRFETRRVLVVSAVAQAAVACALAFVTSLPLMLALAFALGTGVAVTRPAVFALLPRIAGEARLTEANAFLEVAQYGGATAGPLLGGVLSARFGTHWALLIDAGTFLALTLAAALLRVRRYPTSAVDGPGARGSGVLRRGFTFMRSDRLLLLSLVVMGSMILFVGMANVAEVFLAKDVLGAGDTGYGALTAAWTVGMVAGVALLARRIAPGRLPVALLGCAALTGVATIAAGASPTIVLAVAAYVVGGGANGIENVVMRSLIQHRVPDGLRGRAYATYAAVASTADITSSGVGGVMVTLAGARGTMILGGLAAAVVAGIGSVVYRRLPPEVRRVSVRAEADGVPQPR